VTERTKKQLIATLLFISCVISACLLVITPDNEKKQLRNIAQADSLLRSTFSDFNISDSQISSSSVRIDSTFSRKKYRVSVPPAFSKTQLHAVLQQQFLPYDIALPGRVTFPERDMSIHLYYNNSIIRTLNLETDKRLKMQRSFARLIVAFEGKPPAYLLEALDGLGEPIPIAIILRPPLQLPEWWDDFKKQHPDLYIWPQTVSGDNILTGGQQQVNTALKPIREASPNAVLLHFYEDLQAASASVGQNSFSFINARDAFILNAEVGRSGFSQTFRTFIQQSRKGVAPLAIIMGSEESLEWTRRELNNFKKGGLMITPPQKINL
jgi:hypothetical protein